LKTEEFCLHVKVRMDEYHKEKKKNESGLFWFEYHKEEKETTKEHFKYHTSAKNGRNDEKIGSSITISLPTH